MYNSFPEMTSKYRIGVSRVLSLLSSDIFDITLTLYTSVSMCRIAHQVLVNFLQYRYSLFIRQRMLPVVEASALVIY